MMDVPRVFLAVFLACSYSMSALGQAANYPNRAIRIIVPLAAGGNVDIVARTLAEQLTRGFGHPVVVENRPGASSLERGIELTASASPA